MPYDLWHIYLYQEITPAHPSAIKESNPLPLKGEYYDQGHWRYQAIFSFFASNIDLEAKCFSRRALPFRGRGEQGFHIHIIIICKSYGFLEITIIFACLNKTHSV